MSINLKDLVKEEPPKCYEESFYHLSGLLFILVSFTPLIPSGSFFTTYGAAIFWLNFAVVEAFND